MLFDKGFILGQVLWYKGLLECVCLENKLLGYSWLFGQSYLFEGWLLIQSFELLLNMDHYILGAHREKEDLEAIHSKVDFA